MTKIENLLFQLGKTLEHYVGAKFCRKSNGDSPVARKRCVLTQLKWYYGEKVFLSAVTIPKPKIKVLFGDLEHILKHVFSGTFGTRGFANSWYKYSTVVGIDGKQSVNIQYSVIAWLVIEFMPWSKLWAICLERLMGCRKIELQINAIDRSTKYEYWFLQSYRAPIRVSIQWS